MKVGVLGWCLAALALGWVAPEPAAAAEDPLQVQKIVLAEPELGPGQEQLVQISLANPTRRLVRAGLRVEVRSRSDRLLGKPYTRSVSLTSFEEQRVFFQLSAPPTPGNYHVQVEVLDTAFKKPLLDGSPVFRAPFAVVGGGGSLRPLPGMPATASPETPRAAFTPPAGLRFEEPDLLWEDFKVASYGLLLEEPLHIQATLLNVGGDIARNLVVRVEYVNVRLPKQVETISETTITALAPGEQRELEFDFRFPDNTLLGDYTVSLIADAGNNVGESDESNNVVRTARPISLSTIRLLFPEPGFSFQETGLFLFRWDSKRYDEFKVQLGVDPRFDDREKYFDIPQGDKWTSDTEVVPLAGELPEMAKGLLLREKKDVIHWRVLARSSSTGKQGFSEVRTFRLELEEPAQTAPSGPAAAPPGGGAPVGGR